MAFNSYVLVSSFGDRVRCFVAFYGSVWWESDLIKPTCTPVPVRAVGPGPDVVYVGTQDGWVYQLDYADGSTLDKVRAASPHINEPVRGIAHDNGVIYCCVGDSLTATAFPGGPMWRIDMEKLAWGAPIVAGDRIIAGSWDTKLRAAAPDGSLAWVSTEGSFFATEPAVVDDVVYAHAHNELYALNVPDGSVVWKAVSPTDVNFTDLSVDSDVVVTGSASSWARAFSRNDGAPLWSAEIEAFAWRLLAYDGRVYVCGESSIGPSYLHALDLADGSYIWKSQQPVGGAAWILSKPAIDRGSTPHNVFVTCMDNTVTAIARSDGWFAWQKPGGNGAVDPCWADDPLELPMVASSAWLHRYALRPKSRRGPPTPPRAAS